MLRDILKIIPKLDAKDLARMERLLNRRFTRIAKKFGGGIMSVLKGGGIAGVALFFVDKILNPLKDVQESIQRTLEKGDDLATFAAQFNTTAGKLARLQAFGEASGLDAESLRVLIEKFQAAVTQAAANPDQKTAVSAFVGKGDTAEAFFEFVQALQKLTPTQQNFVQQEVFGEKQILKASEFLQADFKKLAAQIGGPSTDDLTASAEYINKLAEYQKIQRAKRNLNDLVTKSTSISPQVVKDIDRGEAIDLARENQRLAKFDDLKKISLATDKLAKILEDAYLKLAPVLSNTLPLLVDQLVISSKQIEKSRTLRGMTPGKDN